jgi:hypothetical protein
MWKEGTVKLFAKKICQRIGKKDFGQLWRILCTVDCKILSILIWIFLASSRLFIFRIIVLYSRQKFVWSLYLILSRGSVCGRSTQYRTAKFREFPEHSREISRNFVSLPRGSANILTFARPLHVWYTTESCGRQCKYFVLLYCTKKENQKKWRSVVVQVRLTKM